MANSCKYKSRCAMDECEVTACMEDCSLYQMYQKDDRTAQAQGENGERVRNTDEELKALENQFDDISRRTKKDFRRFGFH